MKRRDLIKSMGFVSLASTSAFWLYGCKKESVEPKLDDDLSEREKLIVNRDRMSIVDPNNPSEFELKHMPDIIVSQTDSQGFTRVDVTMGSQGFVHPVSETHWNDYIKLYLDDKLVAYNEFEVNIARGFSSFFVPLDGISIIKAEIACNLHGIWENKIAL